ncbi:MAG: carbamoyltransferase family protein [Planctomycetota bacterium]|jgi:carbamoyltransferase
MYILGLSFYYHDSAAALVQDGRVIAAAEEERFSRIKHDKGFPGKAVDFCLRDAGITMDDVEFVVFYEKPFLKFERILMTAFQTFPHGWKVFRESMHRWLTDKLWIKSMMRERLGVPKKKILFCDHHMSHAAASYYCSPFDEAAIMTVDGVGEWCTGTLGRAKGNKITLDKELVFPHSVGLLYSAFTAYCGFEVNEGEYKLMGMAPYGEPRFIDKIHEVVNIAEDGSIYHKMNYFAYHYSPVSTLSKQFEKLFGRPPRDPKLQDKSLDPFYCDVAASIQRVTEDILLRMTTHLHKETGLTKLCMAGGVALNSVANAKILTQTPFEDMYIQPAAGDDGGAVGAAMWAWYDLLDNPKGDYVLDHAFLGSEYSDEEIESWLKENNIPFEKIDDDEAFFNRVCDDLEAGNVCGWFRGKLEWGPRALGSRSIIADARRAEMKDILNAKIKFREAFRPFAPSVTEEGCAEFFELPEPKRHYPARFMLYVVPVCEDKRDVIPAITHVDGSGRLQTANKDTCPDYHRMIELFGERTGVPVIMNTSFNLKGEPIVENPANAFNTFSRSQMDVLYLNNYIVQAKDKKIIEETKFHLRHHGDSVVQMMS